MVEVGKNYYYIGVNINEWANKIVKVIQKTEDNVGTCKDVPVYLCEDENGEIKKVIESNLSLNTTPYNYVYGGMRDCFPENVKRFPTFKNGKYMFEYTWGSNY